MTATHGLGELLRDPVYLRIWLVGVCGGIARWLELLVAGIFAVEMTDSPLLVALLVVLRLAPMAIFGPLVGTFADRLQPRLFLGAGQAVACVISTIVCLLFLSGTAQYWHVAVATFAAGIIWTTEMPLRRRIVGDVAGRERLAPAMSFDSATNNATRMVGPLIGGLLYQTIGAGGAFALSATLFAAAAVFLFGAPATAAVVDAAARSTKVLRDLRDAFAFAAGNKDVLRIFAVTIVFNLWAFPFVSMIPVIGREELGVGAGWIGVLAGLEGGGAFLGALVIAVLGRPRQFRRLYVFGTLGYLILIIVASWMPGPWLMGAVFLGVGFSGAGFTTMQSVLVYAAAPPEMRGRLFGLMVLCIGTGVLGYVNIGLMAEWYGGTTAIRIVAAEGIVPLLLIAVGWRALWRPSDD